jgi:hypothetical protein
LNDRLAIFAGGESHLGGVIAILSPGADGGERRRCRR